ncbi:MAG: methylated-DNA--[protein]-cysteine S-methyltransferase [Proteobacteria bacterium]|nr:methylated-DNA--[protein]-cysteine S-methyltransferase [Pseudomonadota bacterium]
MKHWCRMPSPLGSLLLVEEAGRLLEIGFETGRRPSQPPIDVMEDMAPFNAAIRQLEEYFAGRRTHFDLPLAPRGTAFQQSVWNALIDIPFGKAVSYSDIANAIGNPNAVRAVGLANGRNPIPIIIPCHRVIGKDGSLTGYGGGLPNKRKLLALEGIGGIGIERKSLALFD